MGFEVQCLPKTLEAHIKQELEEPEKNVQLGMGFYDVTW